MNRARSQTRAVRPGKAPSRPSRRLRSLERPSPRRNLRPLALGVLLAIGLAWTVGAMVLPRAWAVLPRTDLLLRSGVELRALQALFSDAERWPEIRRLATRQSVRAIVSESEVLEGGRIAIVFRFELGSSIRDSRRGYEQPYRVVLDPPAAPVVEALRGRHLTSDRMLSWPPACDGAAELDVLRAVLLDGDEGDDGAFAVLLDHLEEHAFGSARVERLELDDPPPGYVDYEVFFPLVDLEGGDGAGREESPAAGARFRARRDNASGAVTAVEPMPEP